MSIQDLEVSPLRLLTPYLGRHHVKPASLPGCIELAEKLSPSPAFLHPPHLQHQIVYLSGISVQPLWWRSLFTISSVINGRYHICKISGDELVVAWSIACSEPCSIYFLNFTHAISTSMTIFCIFPCTGKIGCPHLEICVHKAGSFPD